MLNHKHYPTDFLLKHFLNRCYTHFLFEGNSTGNLRNNLIVASVTGGSFLCRNSIFSLTNKCD